MNRIALSNAYLLRMVLRWRWFPEIVQIIILGIFVSLILYGWGRYTPEGVNDLLCAKSNIVNLLVWGLWWPAMILVTVLLGRIWCAICPLELVNRLTDHTVNLLGIPRKRAARWMRDGWMILLLYGVVQMLVAAVHLHRVPMYTSLYLFAMLVMAMLIGLFYSNRAFCQTLCPVGMLLKIYGRGGVLAVRPVQPSVKADHIITRSCKSLLSPMRLDRARGDDCLMCLDCVQADSEKGRMQFYLRFPWTNLDRRQLVSDWPVTLFIMMVSGFVVYEIAGFWPTVKNLFLWVPYQTGILTGLGDDNGWMKGIWTLFVFPALLWTIVGLAVMPFQQTKNLGLLWRKLALLATFVIIAVHMTKSIEKLAGWGGFLPYVLHDPSGNETVYSFTEGTQSMPPHLLAMPVILTIGAVFLITALFLMYREIMLNTTPQPLKYISKTDIATSDNPCQVPD